MDDTNDLGLSTRTGLPDALRVLVAEYPRDIWQAHSNFDGMVQFWLQRHMMFRELLQRLETDAQARMDGHLGFEDYAPRLSHYAGTLLNELHTHHHIEDDHYFPQLMTLDSRVESAFGLLESDHHALDAVINSMATAANGVLQGGETGTFTTQLDLLGSLLNRHLLDEEEIVVPVILKHGFNRW